MKRIEVGITNKTVNIDDDEKIIKELIDPHVNEINSS